MALVTKNVLRLVHFGKNISCILRHLARRMEKGQKTRLDVTTLIDLTGVYATGGAVTVVAINPLTGSVTRRFQMSGQGDTDVLSAFSYIVRNVVPCNTRLLVTTRLSNLSPVRVVKCLCCPVTLKITTILDVLLHCPHQCS